MRWGAGVAARYVQPVRVHHIALRCNDITLAEAFWTSLFGLAPVRRDGNRAVWLALGDAVLMLERAEPGEARPPDGAMDFIALAVTAPQRGDFLARCAASGVGVEHQTAHTVYVRDPDGRRVGVSSYPL